MLLSLEQIRRVAQQVVHAESPGLEVLAALTAAGGSDYAEVLVIARDGMGESLMSIGVRRQGSESSVRRSLAAKIRAHLACPTLTRPRNPPPSS